MIGMTKRIDSLLAEAKSSEEGFWGERLRKTLDDAGVTDADRLHAVKDKLEEACGLLACTPLDGMEGGEGLASALDKQIEAATEILVALQEVVAQREP